MNKKPMYNVGDLVRVRSWDDMKNEFDMYDDDTIMLPSGEFYSDMKPLCGMTLTVVCSSQTYNGLVWYYLDDNDGGFVMRKLTGHSDWIFTDDMLEPIAHGDNYIEDGPVAWFGGWEFVQ